MNLLNASPAAPVADKAHRPPTYAEAWANPFSRFASGNSDADGTDRVDGQLVMRNLFALMHPVPGDGIPCVVCMCPKVEMVRADAALIVAMMANVHARGDGAVGDCPCQSVGLDGPALPPEHPVTERPILRPLEPSTPPFPAAGAHLNLGPEAFHVAIVHGMFH